MTFVITDPCIDTMDQSCVSVCPVDCIHFEEGEDRILYINPAECIDCGACQPACPVSAIFPESDVPEAQAHFTEINSLWFDDPAAARAKVGGGSAAPATAAAPAAAAPATEVPAPAGDGTEAAPAAETPPLDASPAAPAPAPAAAAPPERQPAPAGTYKYGENGVEGKCARCGTYVIKGGVPFGKKSVLCPEDAKKEAAYLESAGRR